MGYVTEQKSQMHSELGLIMPRLKSFALTLTGGESRAEALVRSTHHHLLARISKERGHTPLALWALIQMQKIWASRLKNNEAERADPRLFQPRSRANDGGASARFAMRIARLNPWQRGALHLVYGERLSYDEVAEVFQIPVSELILRLAKSHAALSGAEGRDAAYPAAKAGASRAPREATPRRQGRAA